MARKKILWLCSWYPSKLEPFNGDFIQRQARAAALYNDIQVIHLAPDTVQETKEKVVSISTEGGLTEQIIYYRKKTSAWGRFWAHYRWLFLYRQALRNYVKKNGKPALVHVHVPLKAGIMAVWFKRRYKVPFVVTEHWGIYNNVADDNYENRSRLFKRFTRLIFGRASGFISVSKYLAEGVNRLVLKINYRVITNVTDTRLFNPIKNPSPVFRFIHVSNMVPLKNAEGILRAFAKLYAHHHNTELVMVGDTNPAIREYAATLQLTSRAISFRGEVPYVQVAKEMQQAHCLVLFSNIENSPCVIGEALCCGLPVIATNVGGIPELVNASNSILVQPGEEAELTEAMQKVMESYFHFDRQAISAVAADRFNADTIGKQINAVYDNVLKDV
jgi:glycosyltransferase involved in cell wall biosynthesis